VDVLGDNGSAALHEAAFQGHTDVMKFLVSQGADPNLRKVSEYALHGEDVKRPPCILLLECNAR
jgi:ankyrin repeat protein